MVILERGDFVITNRSIKPAPIINIDNNRLLISIHEYFGDYIIVDIGSVEKTNIDSFEKLSILSNFGNWFYINHKDLYQELLIESLIESLI